MGINFELYTVHLGPLLLTWFRCNPNMDKHYIHYKVWDEIMYPFLNFKKVQPLKFGNGQVISSYTLVGRWLLIHVGTSLWFGAHYFLSISSLAVRWYWWMQENKINWCTNSFDITKTKQKYDKPVSICYKDHILQNINISDLANDSDNQ